MRLVRSVVATTAVAVVALSACGSTSSAPTTVEAVTTAAGPRVVSIGVITPQEAGLTDFGLGMLRSVELAVAEANAANAVPGWTIEVKAFDDSSDPEKGKAAAAAAIADGSVVAVVGSYNSGVAAAMLPATTVPPLTRLNSMLFRVCPTRTERLIWSSTPNTKTEAFAKSFMMQFVHASVFGA